MISLSDAVGSFLTEFSSRMLYDIWRISQPFSNSRCILPQRRLLVPGQPEAIGLIGELTAFCRREN